MYDIIFLWYFSPTVQLLITLIISGMILIFLRALQICIVSWNENRKMAPECKNMQTHWTWLVYLIENMRFRGKIADIGCIQHFTSKIYFFFHWIYLQLNSKVKLGLTDGKMSTVWTQWNRYGLDYLILMVLQIIFRKSDTHMLIMQETKANF